MPPEKLPVGADDAPQAGRRDQGFVDTRRNLAFCERSLLAKTHRDILADAHRIEERELEHVADKPPRSA
jgi:hypothetical protein